MTDENPALSPYHEELLSGSDPTTLPTKAPISIKKKNNLIVTHPKTSCRGPLRSRKNQTPKKFITSPSSSATTKKVNLEQTTSTSQFIQTTEEIVEGFKGVEESSQHIEEGRLDEMSGSCAAEGLHASGIFEAPSVEGMLHTNVKKTVCTEFESNMCVIDKEGSTSLEKEPIVVDRLIERSITEGVGEETQGETLTQREEQGEGEQVCQGEQVHVSTTGEPT